MSEKIINKIDEKTRRKLSSYNEPELNVNFSSLRKKNDEKPHFTAIRMRTLKRRHSPEKKKNTH